MARPPAIPGIRARLEDHLEKLETEYQAQLRPPAKQLFIKTPDGKVNVRALALAIGESP